MNILPFLLGLLFLIVGAEIAVRGASRLALSLGISPLTIGLTIVALGTSSPEVAVSVNAALANQADLVLGNVIGSNIFNILFILGLSGLIVPLAVSQQLIKIEVPLLIVLTILLFLFVMDGILSRFEGIFFLVGSLLYVGFTIWMSRQEAASVHEEYDQAFGKSNSGRLRTTLNILLIGSGLGLLIFGSQLLVATSVTFARLFGVSETVIGLTIVAIGTSLPEVVTSLIAAYRGERDIAVGNVIGSNLFNILFVLGLSTSVSREGVPIASELVRLDLPILIAVSMICLPIFCTGRSISRWEGGLLLGFYGAYLTFTILSATG